MQDDVTRSRAQELLMQIQEKAVQLSDLEVILEDYEHERRELLRDISRLKASLWELVGGEEPPRLHSRPLSAMDEVND